MRNLPVKLGLSLPNRGPLFGLTTVDAIMETAVLAEESSIFESIWFGDSLIHKPRYESIVMLSAVAARTRRVRLGTACMASFPVRHPVLLGIQWATLDQLSKGRTVLCVCLGGGEERELKTFTVKRQERVPRMLEGIELLRQMWSQTDVHHSGAFYKLDGYRIEPQPFQPSVPIWIAVDPKRDMIGDAGVERALRRVVAHADGYMVDGSLDITPERFRERWGLMESIAAKLGKDLSHFETSIHGMVNINDDKQTAYKESKYYFNHYYGPRWPSEEIIALWLAHGPPKECANLIQSWIDMGFTTPVLRFTSSDQIGQVRRFIQDIVPLLRFHGSM
jgi:alkanesulfonate monooxygenase SsuD/methylene tetrahydromethanopterin reductase-like flavin-dependent oxidoreductase (luciferase family)